jgi:hypothetical protein
MSGKPRLPPMIEAQLPTELVRLIARFIPPLPKPAPPSPGTQRAVERLRTSPKLTAMSLYGLDDFLHP